MTTVDTNLLTPDKVATLVSIGLQHPSVRPFHAHWYQQKTTWAMTRYKGIPILKCPLDLQVYHEMIWQLAPNVVIETGSCFGGSAIWFADQLRMAHGGNFRVISIDIEDRKTPPPEVPNQWVVPTYDNVAFLLGDSSDPALVDRITSWLTPDCRVMVSLDSDHTEAHVFKELQAYGPLVSSGHYLVVEDTNISGRPLICEEDRGPGAAVERYLLEHPEFQKDLVCERYLMTMHPGGWLRRG